MALPGFCTEGESMIHVCVSCGVIFVRWTRRDGFVCETSFMNTAVEMQKIGGEL